MPSLLFVCKSVKHLVTCTFLSNMMTAGSIHVLMTSQIKKLWTGNTAPPTSSQRVLTIIIWKTVTVLLVCPGWPPDVSVCWAHGLLFVWCHVLPCRLSVPSHLVTKSLFQWLQLCLHRYPRLSPYIVSLCLQSCADPLSFVCLMSCEFMFDCAPVFCLPACFSPSGWFLFFFVLFYY